MTTLSAPYEVLLTVQSIENGAKLSVQIPSCDRWLIHPQKAPEFNYEAVTPSLVSELILAAKKTGWIPDKPGPAHKYVLQENNMLEKL
ncbi:MAG: hypothetical protein HUJ26_05570 [Planctomycetaceae bacterium]|nr:hypothetical protein [Planctomycetaceae bacterium]